MKIYSRYDCPDIPGLSCTDPTRTQQHFADEVDINKIISRAIHSGNHMIFTPSERQEFIDTSLYGDYQQALQTISDIDDDFYSLPSSVRRQFQDNPDNYVEFMANPRNMQKAIDLGLLEGAGEKGSESLDRAASNPPGGDPKKEAQEPVNRASKSKSEPSSDSGSA